MCKYMKVGDDKGDDIRQQTETSLSQRLHHLVDMIPDSLLSMMATSSSSLKSYIPKESK